MFSIIGKHIDIGNCARWVIYNFTAVLGNGNRITITIHAYVYSFFFRASAGKQVVVKALPSITFLEVDFYRFLAAGKITCYISTIRSKVKATITLVATSRKRSSGRVPPLLDKL